MPTYTIQYIVRLVDDDVVVAAAAAVVDTLVLNMICLLLWCWFRWILQCRHSIVLSDYYGCLFIFQILPPDKTDKHHLDIIHVETFEMMLQHSFLPFEMKSLGLIEMMNALFTHKKNVK